eukprot:802199-Pelagomonas_calceolata.AAC.3
MGLMQQLQNVWGAPTILLHVRYIMEGHKHWLPMVVIAVQEQRSTSKTRLKCLKGQMAPQRNCLHALVNGTSLTQARFVHQLTFLLMSLKQLGSEVKVQSCSSTTQAVQSPVHGKGGVVGPTELMLLA